MSKSKMRVYSFVSDEKNNAGLKAPADIDFILKRFYSANVIHERNSRLGKIKIIFWFLVSRIKKEIIVVQHPIFLKSLAYKIIDKKKSIILIHDIRGLRNGDPVQTKKEIKVFNCFKYIIVHNDRMKKYLVSRGVEEERLYTIELFDYIYNDNNNKIILSNSDVLYIGNLLRRKSGFLYELNEKKMNFYIHAYGAGYSKIDNKKIIYGGILDGNSLPGIYNGLGLIWDGGADDDDENESWKEYTKYNNPHKLSCYMALGLPAIVWDESAAADFVKKYDVGYTISCVYDINQINYSNIIEKKKNAKKIGQKVRSGFYTKKVFDAIIKDIMDKEL